MLFRSLIKTKIESKLKQVRYDDPLLFEEFSTKIKKTLAEYDQSRDEDKYYQTMQRMADDFNNGIISQDYPASIANDSDAKAFYGVLITTVKSKISLEVTTGVEEKLAVFSDNIKLGISENTKRDWKHNEIAHKAIHRFLDDCLFEMFEELNVNIDKSNVEVIDLLIEEIMKVALVRY